MEIFISYKRKDEEFARQLHKWLTDLGYAAWLDVIEIREGENWDEQIHGALRKSSILIGLLTPESLASNNVMDEWAYAQDNGKLLILVELRSPDVADIPPRYSRLQRIMFWKNQTQGFTKLEARLKELIIESHLGFPYTLLEHKEVSDANTKKYTANILVGLNSTKARVARIIDTAVRDLRSSKYYVSDLSAQRYGDREADAVIIFAYQDLGDLLNTNWICRARWLRNPYPSTTKPGGDTWGGEIYEEIELDWKQTYAAMRDLWQKQPSNKQEWVAKVRSILPQMDKLYAEALILISNLDNESVAREDFASHMEAMEAEALRLYQESGNQKYPPFECLEADKSFQSMIGIFHNIFIPFAAWGKIERKWKSKEWLMRDALKHFEVAKLDFDAEWRKLHR